MRKFKKEKINYAEIDSDIRSLVRSLNEIPFVATLASCQGHLKDKGLCDVVADEGHKFLYAGDIIFSVDESHTLSKGFLDEIGGLKANYDFVDLEWHYCNQEDCPMEGTYFLNLGFSDLTLAEQVSPTDNIETQIKKKTQVETDIGLKRINAYRRVWNDIQRIAEKYIRDGAEQKTAEVAG